VLARPKEKKDTYDTEMLMDQMLLGPPRIDYEALLPLGAKTGQNS
jgi:hypothetical protein